MQQQYRYVRGEICSEQTLASRDSLQSTRRGVYFYGFIIQRNIWTELSRFKSFFNFQAGNYVRDDVVACTIQLISETQSQQGYAVSALWYALEKDTSDKQPLAQVATWCIGEYGDLLLYGPPSEDAETPINVSSTVATVVLTTDGQKIN